MTSSNSFGLDPRCLDNAMFPHDFDFTLLPRMEKMRRARATEADGEGKKRSGNNIRTSPFFAFMKKKRASDQNLSEWSWDEIKISVGPEWDALTKEERMAYARPKVNQDQATDGTEVKERSEQSATESEQKKTENGEVAALEVAPVEVFGVEVASKKPDDEQKKSGEGRVEKDEPKWVG
jgi:hypothetical protein